jgi:uncharacterized protein YbcC (UPF0753/DUF2309 family)
LGIPRSDKVPLPTPQIITPPASPLLAGRKEATSQAPDGSFFPLQETLRRLARWLPHQGPLKDFIHHNTLHAFAEFPFVEACLRASRLYGAWTFLPLSTYRELYSQGAITDQALAEVLFEGGYEWMSELGAPVDDWRQARDAMLSTHWGEGTPGPGIAQQGLRSRWKSQRGLRLEHRIAPKLFRLLGQFLDQGIAMWGAPHSELSLLQFVRQLVESSWLPLRPWSSARLRPLLQMAPEQSVPLILSRFVGPGAEPLYERYLLEMLLAHAGWSGMVWELEIHPEGLLERRRVSLAELCALELMAEYEYVCLDLGEEFPALHGPQQAALPPLPYEAEFSPSPTPAEQVALLWQRALERTYRSDFLGKLRERRSVSLSGHSTVCKADLAPRVQAFFCLDDREGSLRRHFEAQNPAYETYGFAGFFGVDCVFQGVDDAFPSKHCPAPLHPKHRIREQRRDSRRDARSLRQHEVHDHSHTLVRGFLLSQTLGLWSAVKLVLSIFKPSLNPLASSSLQRVDAEAAMTVHRGDDQEEDGFFSGYTDAEMADRVAGVLEASGLVARPLAGLVIFVGHGSSSINNPYFAAYDCGACSGKGGGPNARAVALMANRPQVRRLLARRGVVIPDSCWFLGALHDTTRDEMQYYDLESVPASHRNLLEEVRQAFEQAMALNAKERCRRFANISPKIDPRDAILAVRRRSVSIFEPRPELNHATNAACIIGRRQLSRGLSLDRRCFLSSYDPGLDPQGKILASLLSAIVPVCGGINLEYYFSRLDPTVYGAGSKLPHNIQGLIGVINGTEGDLLTGLPTQMTEVHDPLRLLLLVEQSPEIALRAVQSDPELVCWVENGWIQYLCWDYGADRMYEYQHGTMRQLELGQGMGSEG